MLEYLSKQQCFPFKWITASRDREITFASNGYVIWVGWCFLCVFIQSVKESACAQTPTYLCDTCMPYHVIGWVVSWLGRPPFLAQWLLPYTSPAYAQINKGDFFIFSLYVPEHLARSRVQEISHLWGCLPRYFVLLHLFHASDFSLYQPGWGDPFACFLMPGTSQPINLYKNVINLMASPSLPWRPSLHAKEWLMKQQCVHRCKSPLISREPLRTTSCATT